MAIIVRKKACAEYGALFLVRIVPDGREKGAGGLRITGAS